MQDGCILINIVVVVAFRILRMFRRHRQSQKLRKGYLVRLQSSRQVQEVHQAPNGMFVGFHTCSIIVVVVHLVMLLTAGPIGNWQIARRSFKDLKNDYSMLYNDARMM